MRSPKPSLDMTIDDKAAAKAEPVVTTLYIISRAQDEKQKQTIPARRASTTNERGRGRSNCTYDTRSLSHVRVFAIQDVSSSHSCFAVWQVTLLKDQRSPLRGSASGSEGESAGDHQGISLRCHFSGGELLGVHQT